MKDMINLIVPSVKQEKVCDFETKINLYDASHAIGRDMPNSPTCESTIDGKPVRIDVALQILLLPAQDGKPATKSATGILDIYGKDISQFLNILGTAGTDKLDSKNIFLTFSSQTFVNESQPAQQERFDADLVFVDEK